MTIGIYRVDFSYEYFYIGQSTNIEGRFKSHLRLLQNNLHDNELMQDVYNTNNYTSFSILEICSLAELDVKEKHHINITNATVKGLNKLKGATSILYGEDTSNAVYTNNIIVSIFLDIVNTGVSLAQINRNYSVANGVSQAIANCNNHTWLSELYPKEYALLKEKLSTRNAYASAISQGITYPDIISPSGEVFKVTHLNKFAREHNINASCLCKLLNGKIKSRKGWKLAA